jgi:hypothetical protein
LMVASRTCSGARLLLFLLLETNGVTRAVPLFAQKEGA